MGRKTIILTENQFNEICGANTAYLDNQSDYAKDGTIQMRTDGAAGNGEGDEYYSKPPTTDDIADSMTPETLWAMLFRNGGHGLWGHYGSGLRASDFSDFDTTFSDDDDEYDVSFPDTDDDDEHEYVVSLAESNSELEGRAWKLDLDNDGMDKTYSYTDLTTKKTELKKKLTDLVRQNAPDKMIKKMKAKYAAICGVLGRETGAIKGRKTTMKNLGFNNQFQKAGGSKNSGNGKAHTRKKQTDPNVGTGYITYA